MEIIKVKDYEEVVDMLYSFDKQFQPSISEKVHSLEEYAQKLITKGEVYIGFVDKEKVGFFSIYHNIEEVYISLIAITPLYRQKHLGKQLLQEIEYRAKELGKNTIRLEVDNCNEVAKNFYRKNGFVVKAQADTSSQYMIKTW